MAKYIGGDFYDMEGVNCFGIFMSEYLVKRIYWVLQKYHPSSNPPPPSTAHSDHIYPGVPRDARNPPMIVFHVR